MRISLGGWFEFYDLFMNAYISLGLLKEGLFSATASSAQGFAAFIAAGFSGMFVGTLIFGWVSDRFGRRTTFTWSLVFYSLMTLLMAFGRSAAHIDILRFLAGIGIGVQIITIDAYVTEITPPADRGRFIAFSQAISYTAVPVVALLATLLVPHVIAGLTGWRWVAILGALGVIFVWPIQRGLPESPRWYESHGRDVEAARIVAQFENEARAQSLDQCSRANVFALSNYEEPLGQRPYLRRAIMLLVFNFFQTIGYYGFAAWVPILLFQEGVSFVHSLAYTFVIALVSPLGPIAAMHFADRWERKWQIVGLSAAIAAFGLLFAQMRAPAAIIGVGLLIQLANNWFSCAFHAYQTELFPTRSRARGVGFVYSWSRASGAIVGFLIAWALRDFGVVGVFVLIAAAMTIAAGVIAALGPLTNRRALEALSP